MECFTVYSNEIVGRLDAFYYKPEYTGTINKIKKTKFSYFKLGDLISNLSGGATPKLEGDFYTDGAGIPFLRVQNITEEGIKLDDVKYIKKEVHEVILKRSQLKKDDIVFTITGRIGSVAVVPDNFEGNINQHSVRFHLKNKIENIKIIPYFISIFFNTKIGRNLSFRSTTGGTRPALDYESLKNLNIPLPPLETQNHIVKIMDEAYKTKKQKEQEAKKLLNSINDYVLNKLGIKLPNLKDKMCFVVDSKKMEGKRIDPKRYSKRPDIISKSIKKSKYNQKELSKIVIESIAGEWGKDPLFIEQGDEYLLCNVLRNTNFNNKLNLDFEKVAQRLILKNKFQKIKLKKGDILIEKSGGSPIQPVGRVALIEIIEGNYTFSNFLQCFRINKEDCLPEYLFAYLKAIYSLNYMEYLQNQTTGIKNLIMEEYLSIPISLPPLEIQNKIAKEVKTRMETADKLRKEAEKILTAAKESVENIILGNKR